MFFCRSAARLALLALLAGVACHRGGRDTGEPAPDAEPAANEPVDVRVRSFHAQPVRVFLVRGANSLRLGTVAESQGRVFRIPRDFYGRGVTTSFVFTLVGGGEEYRSEPMVLRGGNYVEWTLAERLKYSTVFVW